LTIYRITYLPGREGLEFFPRQQHVKDIIADNHAGGGVVGELGIETKAEPAEKRD
jgi:hypothetical protein